MPLLLAAPDKFPGTATAAQVAGALCRGAADLGWGCDAAPVADGGEGILEALGGRIRRTRVQGPLGEVVDAEWRMLEGDVPTAVIEMARAAGIGLVGGPEWNDPLRASTAGVGQLIMAAVAAGARRVIVGAGGSATTDGGQGCIEALEPRARAAPQSGGTRARAAPQSGGNMARLAGVELVVACDVPTRFVDAAAVFAGQKGATPKQVTLLTRRLERLAQLYEDTYGVDVRDLPGSGAAGGLAGGLAAIGAELVPGFDLVAEVLDLPARVEDADLVATGEGFLDEQSFSDKAVGGVLELACSAGVPALVVAGEILDDVAVPTAGDISVVSLVECFGPERAWADTTACIEEVARRHLANVAR